MLTTPTKQKLTESAVMGTGAIAGATASNALMNLVPSKYLQDYETPIRGVAVAGGVALAASVKGKSSGANFAKGAALGVAVINGIKIIASLTASSVKTPTDSDSAITKLTAGAAGKQTGLNGSCGCDAKSYQLSRMPIVRSLNAPEYDFPVLDNAKKNKSIVTAFD